MYTTSAPTPPSTPEPGAAWSEFKHIRVTRVAEHSTTSPDRDVELPGPALGSDPYNQSWKLICVPADQIETRHSRWLNSELGINIAGKTEDGKSYEVVVHASYVQWLCFFGCELYFEYDPMAPTEEDILVHGIWEAAQRAHARFLLDAVKKIRFRRYRGYEEYYHDLARLNGLMIPLERALLIYDILESDPRVRKYFVRCLVFLGLNLLGYYNSSDASQLLVKDEADVLKPFKESQENPLKALSKPKVPVIRSKGLELQTHSLVRDLLEFCGDIMDCRQHTFEQEYTTGDNLNLYGILVGVTGTNRFGDFDPKEMYDALSKSKVFVKDADIGSLDTVGWSMQMMEFLPIGFPEGHLDNPSQVLSGLGSREVEVDLVGIYL